MRLRITGVQSVYVLRHRTVQAIPEVGPGRERSPYLADPPPTSIGIYRAQLRNIASRRHAHTNERGNVSESSLVNAWETGLAC